MVTSAMTVLKDHSSYAQALQPTCTVLDAVPEID